MNENFEDIKRLPTGRAALFIPELEVLKEFKEAPEEFKEVTLRFDDKISEALQRLSIPESYFIQIKQTISRLKNPVFKDPYILVIATYIHANFPLGFLNVNEVEQAGKISPNAFRQMMNSAVNLIPYKKGDDGLEERKSGPSKNELALKIMHDVIAYHRMILQSLA